MINCENEELDPRSTLGKKKNFPMTFRKTFLKILTAKKKLCFDALITSGPDEEGN